MADPPGDGQPTAAGLSKSKQQDLIVETMENNARPLFSASTIKEEVPYKTTKPTLQNRLQELENQERINSKPFGPYDDDANGATRYHYLSHPLTDQPAPTDAELKSAEEGQILRSLSDGDGELPSDVPSNAHLISDRKAEQLESVTNSDGEFLVDDAVNIPYDNRLLQSRIGKFLYGGPKIAGDLLILGLLLVGAGWLLSQMTFVDSSVVLAVHGAAVITYVSGMLINLYAIIRGVVTAINDRWINTGENSELA